MAAYGDVATAPATAGLDIAKSLQSVMDNVRKATDTGQPVPRVVAVSKIKPAEDVLTAYNAGQRHFGENYVPELNEKASNVILRGLDIKWHFIGHLQSNKCKMLCSIPNIWMVESVDSERLATVLNTQVQRAEVPTQLRVMIQVNTSGEDTKSGCHPDACLQLANHVISTCPHLQLCGLMTIGKTGHDYSRGPNPDFECLIRCRNIVAKGTGRNDLDLSMGMSSDYVEAIQAGSTNVRVGSIIFGERDYSKK